MEEKMIKEKILEFISKNKEDHEKLEAFATFIDDYFPDEEKKILQTLQNRYLSQKKLIKGSSVFYFKSER